MPIYHDGKKMKPYRGYRKPVNVYYGDKKVAGWKNSTQTGNNLTFQTTYNDTAEVTVKGKTLQKSEWVHKQGLTTQSGTPTPETPIPLVSNLQAGTYKTEDWKGDWWEFTLTSDLCGIDTVKDSVEFDKYSHNGFINRKIAIKIFDGTETWSNYTSGTNNGYVAFLSGTDILSGAKSNGLMKSTIFNGYASGAILYPSAIEGQCTSGTPGGYTVIKILPVRLTTPTTEGLRTLLTELYNNGTPNKVYYELNSPTRTSLTFTLNNSSTAPECPMTFLTSTPSLEYPATVWDASGSVSAAKPPVIYSVPAISDSLNETTGVFTRSVQKYTLTANDIDQLNTGTYINFDAVRIVKNADAVFKGVKTKLVGSLLFNGKGNIEYITLDSAAMVGNTSLQAYNDYVIYGVAKGTYADLAAAKAALAGTVIYYQLATPLTINPPYTGYSDSATATIETLRSNAAGTVYDEQNVTTGAVTRRIGRIESYNGEEVGDDWVSSTGALDTGATVVYVLAEPTTETVTPQELPTYYPTTIVNTTSNTVAELTTTATVRVEE